MTDCPHTPEYPDLAQVPTLQDALSHCSLVEGDENVAHQRALTAADGVTTRIDQPYWQKLDDAQKAAVVAHERAHPQIGMKVNCEGCADKVGGYYMRAWGYSPDVVQHAFSSLRAKRGQDQGTIGDNAVVGAQAAEKGLAARGLLGAPSAVVRNTLLAQRQKLTQAKPAASLPSLAQPTQPVKKTDTTKPVSDTHPLTPSPTQPQTPAQTGTAAQGSAPSTDATTQAGVSLDGLTSAATLDPGGPGDSIITTTPIDALPQQQLTVPDATPQTGPNAGASSGGTDIAGDIVSSVLGESARPHAVPVLIAAGVAATIAVVLVVLVRHATK